MNIFPRKNLNFFTKKVPGGLVFCPAGAVTNAPDDIDDPATNPWFQTLVDSGDVTVIKGEADLKGRPVIPGGAPGPTGEPLHSPDDETEELGKSVSSDEFQKTQKPAEPKPAQQSHPVQTSHSTAEKK